MSKRVRVEVVFPVLRGPRIRGLFHPCRVALNVLRGRVTETAAWFEVELSGPVRRVDAALRGFRSRGALVQAT
jgi:hypothetical protein